MLAIKTQHAIGNDKFLNLKGQWHKNNQQTNEQDNLQAGIRLILETAFFDKNVPLDGGSRVPNDGHIYWSADIALNRKATFGDKKDVRCISDPQLKACGRQNLDSARLMATASPFFTRWEAQNDQTQMIYIGYSNLSSKFSMMRLLTME